MNKATTVLLAMTIVMLSTVACTPKPDRAQPVAEDFFAAISAQDWDGLSGVVDDSDQAIDQLSRSFEDLNAQGFTADIGDVQQSENTADVHATYHWQLPGGDELDYPVTLGMVHHDGDWLVRWTPGALHPKAGAGQHLSYATIAADRASIVSSDGQAVLVPGVVHRIIIDPTSGAKPGETARQITSVLDDLRRNDPSVSPTPDATDLENQLRDATGSYSVATVRDSSFPQVRDRLGGIPGIRFNDEAAMVTPDPGFAPDIMSRVENIVNDRLDGVDGWQVSLVTSDGAPIEKVAGRDADEMPAITVGINRAVQKAAEQAVNQHEGQQAMIVAIRPSTGEILAVAQNRDADRDGDVALTGQYPPGSIFKIITATAGEQHQGLTPGSTVPCPGTMNIQGRTVTNYNGFSLGNVPLERAFAQSCNTTFADISTKLAPGELAATAEQFGIGVDYDVAGLPTITGSVPEGDTALERTESGYGQGNTLVSPFGMALAAATAARGSVPEPVLISDAKTPSDRQARPLDPQALSELQQMMRQVVTSGTASALTASGDIHGKTGEAEVNQGSHSWFAGYRADDDIAFASLIVLGGGSEAAVAMTDSFFHSIDSSAPQ